MAGKPSDYFGRLMCFVIVQNQMYFADIGRERRIHGFHEFEELLVAMTAVATADHLAGCDIRYWYKLYHYPISRAAKNEVVPCRS